MDALAIYRYGVDRNGLSYPIKFVSWGGGQDALYGYLLVPFVAIFGLSTAIVRLPMLISGILSLPLLFFVAMRTVDLPFGLLSMFFLAISPWHILLSRWGLEANLFPFLFLAGYWCLLNYKKSEWWFVGANVLFGLCLYAYGTAYAMVPVFVVCTIAILIWDNYLSNKKIIIGVFTFVLVSIPIGILIVINTLKIGSMILGPITIPHFPVEARFEAATVFSAINPGQTIISNLSTAIYLLSTQSDGLLYNVVDPFGYFYTVTFPLALTGITLILAEIKKGKKLEDKLLLVWIGASISIALIQPVNINRFNIIFIPLILCIARSIYWLGTLHKAIIPITISALLIGFIGFNIAYHGRPYRQQAGLIFHNGLLPAIKFAQEVSSVPICIDDNNMPYIFVLFLTKTNPEN